MSSVADFGYVSIVMGRVMRVTWLCVVVHVREDAVVSLFTSLLFVETVMVFRTL
jgi:hypothetical protein